MIFHSHKLSKEITWSILAKGVASLLFIALNIFLARYLGPKQFGAWSFFFSILTILYLVSNSGLNTSSRKYIAQHNNTDKLGSILKSSFRLRIVYSLSFSIFLLVIYKALASALNRPDFEPLFLAGIPLVFFASLVEYFKNVFQGLHRLKYNFFINLSEHGLKLLFVSFFLFFVNGLVSIIYSFSLAFIVTSIIASYFLYFYFYKSAQSPGSHFEKDIIKYSVPLFVTTIGFVIATEIDTVLIGILSTDTEVGIYAVAKQATVKLPHIAFAIASGAMPVFAKLSPENKKELIGLLYKLLKINSAIFGSIGVIILSTSWFFIPIIYGVKYKAAIFPLIFLIPYLIFASYSVFLTFFLDYQGKAIKRAINLIIAIIVNIVLDTILIPQYGAAGAAIATSVSYAPYVFLNWLEVKKTFDYIRGVAWVAEDTEVT